MGYTLAAAQEAGLNVRAVDVPTQAQRRRQLLRARRRAGTSRLVVDEDRRVVVGATFTGPEVAEFLQAATIAVVGEVRSTGWPRGAGVPHAQRGLALPDGAARRCPGPAIAACRVAAGHACERPLDTTARRAQAVLDRVRSVPRGRVTTYADLSPEAPRYAGAVLAAVRRSRRALAAHRARRRLAGEGRAPAAAARGGGRAVRAASAWTCTPPGCRLPRSSGRSARRRGPGATPCSARSPARGGRRACPCCRARSRRRRAPWRRR